MGAVARPILMFPWGKEGQRFGGAALRAHAVVFPSNFPQITRTVFSSKKRCETDYPRSVSRL